MSNKDALTATSVNADTSVTYLALQDSGLVRVPHYEITYFPNGTSDNAADLQAVLDVALASQRRVTLRTGEYPILSPVWFVGDPTSIPYPYYQMNLLGEHPGYTSVTHGTLIDASGIVDLPALIGQTFRTTQIENIQIGGPNLAPGLRADPNSYTQSDWLTVGVRANRYSPQCGIALDPTLHHDYATLNGAGNAYALTYFSGSGGSSSNLCMKNLTIRDHVVGIMVSPSGGTNSTNTDLFLYNNVHIANCDIGLSLGQSQSRQHTFLGGSISQCRIAAAGDIHGLQKGVPPRFVGTQFGETYCLFSFKDEYGTPLMLDGVRCESTGMIGHWGVSTSSSKTSMTVIGSSFQLGFNAYGSPKLPPYILESHSPVKFTGGGFIFPSTSDGYVFNFCGSSNDIEFDSVTFDCAANSSVTRPFIATLRDHERPRARFRNCWVNTSSGTYRLDDNYSRELTAQTRYNVSNSCESLTLGADRYLYKFRDSNNYVNQAISGGSISIGASTISFTLTLAANQNSVCMVGDIIQWRCTDQMGGLADKYLPMLRVTSATPTAGVSEAVVCEMLFDANWYDNTYAPTNASIFVHNFAFDPAVSFTGDVTSGSATIGNLSHTGTTYFQAGDWIYPSTGIRNPTRLTAVGASTLTMNRTASASNTGSELRNGKWVLQT